MFQYFKAKKKAKEIEKLSKKFPLWNYGVRKYGYPCWESYVLHMRLFTAQEIELIHEVILRQGNGGSSGASQELKCLYQRLR